MERALWHHSPFISYEEDSTLNCALEKGKIKSGTYLSHMLTAHCLKKKNPLHLKWQLYLVAEVSKLISFYTIHKCIMQ